MIFIKKKILIRSCMDGAIVAVMLNLYLDFALIMDLFNISLGLYMIIGSVIALLSCMIYVKLLPDNNSVKHIVVYTLVSMHTSFLLFVLIIIIQTVFNFTIFPSSEANPANGIIILIGFVVFCVSTLIARGITVIISLSKLLMP